MFELHNYGTNCNFLYFYIVCYLAINFTNFIDIDK